MINEIEMKRLEKRLDKLDDFMNAHVKRGIEIPEEIRNEYRATSDKYNEYVKILKEKANEKFLKILDKPFESDLNKDGEVPF